MGTERKARFKLVKWNRQLVSGASSVLFFSQFIFGAAPIFAAERPINSSPPINQVEKENFALQLGQITSLETLKSWDDLEYALIGTAGTEEDLKELIQRFEDNVGHVKITLTNDIELSSPIVIDGVRNNNLTIDGADYTVSPLFDYSNKNHSIFKIENGGKVNLENMTIDGKEKVRGIYLNDRKTVLNTNKVVIQNGYAETGGGIRVNGYSTYNMYGGRIVDNKADNGGGVYVDANGSFNLYGGEIYDNQATRKNGDNVFLPGSAEVVFDGVVFGDEESIKIVFSQQETGDNGLLIEYDKDADGIDLGNSNGLSLPKGIEAEKLEWGYRETADGEMESGVWYKRGSSEGFIPVPGLEFTKKLPLPKDAVSLLELESPTYNGKVQEIAQEKFIKGANYGDITEVEYIYSNQDDPVAPINAGDYRIKVKLEESTYYQAGELLLEPVYTIQKAQPTEANFEYYKGNINLPHDDQGVKVAVTPKDQSLEDHFMVYYIDSNKGRHESIKEPGEYAVVVDVTDNQNFITASNIPLDLKVSVLDDVEMGDITHNFENEHVYSGQQPDVHVGGDSEVLGEINAVFKQEENVLGSPPIDVGVYEVHAKFSGSKTHKAGEIYLGNITILPATVKVSAEPMQIKQGEPLPEPIFKYQGFIGEDNETNAFEKLPQINFGNIDGKTIGDFPVQIDPGILNQNKGKNYQVSTESATLSVVAKEDPGKPANPNPTDPDPIDPVDPAPTDPTDEDRHPLYRVYNKNDGAHLYTASLEEARGLIEKGWQDEGIGWHVGKTEGQIVYRLYNPNSGEHFFTLNQAEYEAVAQAGWQKEGEAFRVADNQAIPIYRIFNPNSRDAGSHHYTLSEVEASWLINLGWLSEKIAFFGK